MSSYLPRERFSANRGAAGIFGRRALFTAGCLITGLTIDSAIPPKNISHEISQPVENRQYVRDVSTSLDPTDLELLYNGELTPRDYATIRFADMFLKALDDAPNHYGHSEYWVTVDDEQ